MDAWTDGWMEGCGQTRGRLLEDGRWRHGGLNADTVTSGAGVPGGAGPSGHTVAV